MEFGDAGERTSLPGRAPTAVITDLRVLRPDPVTRELTLMSVHTGVTAGTIVESTAGR